MCILGWVSTEFHMKQAGDLYVWRRGGGTGAKPADNKQCNFSSLNEGGTRKGRRRPYLSKRLTDANTRRGRRCRRSSSGLDPSEGTPHSRTHSLRERVPCLHRLHRCRQTVPHSRFRPCMAPSMPPPPAPVACACHSAALSIHFLSFPSSFPPAKNEPGMLGYLTKMSQRGRERVKSQGPLRLPSFLPSPLLRLQLLASNN